MNNTIRIVHILIHNDNKIDDVKAKLSYVKSNLYCFTSTIDIIEICSSLNETLSGSVDVLIAINNEIHEK